MSWKKEKPNKKENMLEYKMYLEYRKDHKGKLTYHEFKKNHKHRYIVWAKNKWSVELAKRFIKTTFKITEEEFNQM